MSCLPHCVKTQFENAHIGKNLGNGVSNKDTNKWLNFFHKRKRKGWKHEPTSKINFESNFLLIVRQRIKKFKNH